MKVIKTTIENSVNDHKAIGIYLVETEEQEDEIRNKKHEEVREWNSLGPESGHMSTRYLDIESYDPEECTLSDIENLTLCDLARIISFLNQLPLTNP